MLNHLESQIKNKRIVILGFGMEGQSSFRFFLKHFPNHRFLIADKDPAIREHPLLNKSNFRGFPDLEVKNLPLKHKSSNPPAGGHKINSLNNSLLVCFRALVNWWQKNITKKTRKIQISTGENYLEAINETDFIIKSPGIKLPENFKRDSMYSQTDLFIQAFRNQIIGITGTKGKSTSASLMFHLLKDQNKKVILLGNIGKPALDYCDQIDDDTFIVFEMSAHQLEYVRFSPSYAVLLNLFPEHLDYFQNLESYFKAKLNIAKFQDAGDFFFSGDSTIGEFAAQTIGRKTSPMQYILESEGIIQDETQREILSLADLSHLKGLHQLKNCVPLLNIAHAIGLDEEKAIQSIKNFKPLPHRIEYIGKIKGIRFYNDSISTIPEASIEALKALKEVNYLILGGFDRGIDYQKIYDYLDAEALEEVFFIGPAGHRMYTEMPAKMNFKKTLLPNLHEFENHLPGLLKSNTDGICLLSPAAASYDEFKNFEERGDFYKSLIAKFM